METSEEYYDRLKADASEVNDMLRLHYLKIGPFDKSLLNNSHAVRCAGNYPGTGYLLEFDLSDEIIEWYYDPRYDHSHKLYGKFN